MNSNPQHRPSLFNPPLVDKTLSVQDSSQLVMETERLHELQRQVAAQEQRLHSLRQQAADASNSRVASEQDLMKSLIFTKERELAGALMKVAELTSQLEHLRRTHVDDRTQPQRMLETSSHPKDVVQKIIPIKIIREDGHLSGEAKRVSRQESSTRQSTEGNKGVRVIPIVLEKNINISRPTMSSAVQQPPQGTPYETGQIYSMQTNEYSSVIGKGSDRSWTATEMKKGVRCIDVNENVKDNGNIVAGLSADVKNSSVVNFSVDGNSRPNDSASEKVAIERVYVEKVGKAEYNYGKAESEKINVAVFESERTVENKFKDSSDIGKISKATDRLVESKTVNIKENDNNGKLQYASQSSAGARSDRGDFVKDKKNAANRSHSVGDRTDSDRRLLNEKKEDSVGKNSRNRAVDVSSRHSSEDKKEECKPEKLSDDKKSFSDFSLSDQLVELGKDIFKGNSGDVAGHDGTPTVTCRNVTSDGGQDQPPTDSGRANESGFKTDRARFFMDMVKDAGSVQPWKEMPRSPVSCEIRKPICPVVSPSTSMSRGRSSSSAIMSRFAPQPYGRSKSVDSGSLRVPLATLSGAVHRERSPDVTVGVTGTSSYKMPSQHLVTSSYDHRSYVVKSPGVISESRIEMETATSISKATPYSLLFQKSISADGSSSQPKTSLLRKSFPEENVNVRSISSLSVRPISELKPTMTETCPTSSTNVLMGDKIGYSMPLTSGPVTIFSPLQNSSSPARESPSKHEHSSSASPMTPTADAPTKFSAVDSKSPSLEHIVSPLGSASCGVTRSFNTKPSIDAQTVVPTRDTKSPSAKSSSLNAAVPRNFEISQQNFNLLPEQHRSPVVDVTKSSLCDTASSGTKLNNHVLSSSPSSAASKPDDLSRSIESKSEEEIPDTAWDSNVKRLAHIYAVTIGGTVQGRTSYHGNRNRESSFSRGADGNTFSNGSNVGSSPSTLRHSKAERRAAKLLGPELSKLPGQDLLSSRSDETTSSSVQHQQTPSCSSVAGTSSEVVDSVEQLKIDTSADSVSSALSVLLKSSSSAHSSPVRPSRLRTTISSAYRRKLGNDAIDNYSQNMTLLYGDCLVKRDGSVGSNVQESSEEKICSPPLQETPLMEDLPRILALDTLDGMPFYPRISSHLRDSQGSSAGAVNGRVADLQTKRSEFLKSGDVEVTVISSPKQTADLVRLDPIDGDAKPTGSFNPSDDIVSSYIDDPSASDGTRFSTEATVPSHGRLFPGRNGKSRRHVTFDHISLLLNAALEGEKDLVVEIVNKSANPNQKTETGLSALHNAVCGNHADILKYLVEFGCDVNVADNDGWTPLHCAASTNNVEMLRMLVENGASILPMTISDRETPVQKCCRNLPAYDEAVKYLTDVANALGVANDGWVYVTSSFTNVCHDELVLSAGERLKIIRRGDENESEWWWAQNGDIEGYVPQSLLALYPRIQPKWEK